MTKKVKVSHTSTTAGSQSIKAGSQIPANASNRQELIRLANAIGNASRKTNTRDYSCESN